MTNAKGTLVCFAAKEEARYFRKLAAHRPEIEVLLTGMGPRNAEKAIRAALENRRPSRVITAGFAGGLSPDLVARTIVFQAEPALGLEAQLRAFGARQVRFHCAERVITTAAEKHAVHLSTGADAVEMESQVIHSICREHKIPVATLRVILDTAVEDLVLDFNRLMSPDLRIDSRKLTMVLLKSPWKIPALLRLQKLSATAAKRLGEALARVLLE